MQKPPPPARTLGCLWPCTIWVGGKRRVGVSVRTFCGSFSRCFSQHRAGRGSKMLWHPKRRARPPCTWCVADPRRSRFAFLPFLCASCYNLGQVEEGERRLDAGDAGRSAPSPILVTQPPNEGTPQKVKPPSAPHPGIRCAKGSDRIKLCPRGCPQGHHPVPSSISFV